MGESLTLTYRGSGAAATGVWLQAEQANIPRSDKVDWRQLRRMLSYARAGQSAMTAVVDDCLIEVEGDVVRVPLQVNVYPSSMTLPYTIAPAYGTVGPEVRMVTVPRERDLVFEMSVEAESGELLIDPKSLLCEWESPVWGQDMRTIQQPAISWAAGKFTVPETVFGFARAKCRSLGWQHDILMEFTRTPGQRVSNIQNAVQIGWYDGDGVSQTQSVDLKFPAILERLLSYCGSGGDLISLNRKDKTKTQVNYYYSECSGKHLLTTVDPPTREPISGKQE